MRIEYEYADVQRIVHGTLVWDGKHRTSLDEVITSVFDSVEDYFLWPSLTPAADHRLCDALGLSLVVSG
jgi:hypothetical protein